MIEITAEFQAYTRTVPTKDDGKRWGVALMYDMTKKETFTAVGVLPEHMGVEGLIMKLQGEYVEDPKYGNQFRYSQAVAIRPKGEFGTISFLKQIRGVGKRTAQDIWDAFGEDSIDMVINRSDEVVACIRGFSATMAEEGSAVLSQSIGDAEYRLPLVTLFEGIGFPKKLVDRVLEMGWADPVSRISANPFILMDFQSVGFKKCDHLRAKLNLPSDMPERREAATLYSFSQRESVWTEKNLIRHDVATLLHLNSREASDLLNRMYKTDLISYRKGFLSATTDCAKEQEVCRRLIMKSSQRETRWPDLSNRVGNGPGNITIHQHNHLRRACDNGRAAFLFGSPGTGKTYTAAQIIKAFPGSVQACAPTGKAAQRLGEVFSEYGIQVTPVTAHRMLGAMPNKYGDWAFAINGIDSYIDADLVVVDEASMLDNFLASAILRALNPMTHVLFIGDDGQLPPVGRGSMLRDWISWCSENDHYGFGLLKP